MKKLLLSLATATAIVSPAHAQHYDMTQWGAGRGYTEAPYFRYEAEPGHCRSYSGVYLPQSDVQTDLQSEASNQQAITIGSGGYVEWKNDSGAADGVTLRFSVPWGQTARVGVYGADGQLLGTMDLNTDHSWEFCNKIQGSRSYKPEIYSIHVYNPDEFVRMRFDETHTLLSREIRRDETFRIGHISGAQVTVDFLEIEKARKVEFQEGWVRWNQQIESNLQLFIDSTRGRPYTSTRSMLVCGASLRPEAAPSRGEAYSTPNCIGCRTEPDSTASAAR